MKKWLIVAYPEHDEGCLPRQEAIVEAQTHGAAIRQGFRLFPECYEVGAYEIEERN